MAGPTWLLNVGVDFSPTGWYLLFLSHLNDRCRGLQWVQHGCSKCGCSMWQCVHSRHLDNLECYVQTCMISS
jgi:hypothetical protein